MKTLFYAIFGIIFMVLNFMLICTPEHNEQGQAVRFFEYWTSNK